MLIIKINALHTKAFQAILTSLPYISRVTRTSLLPSTKQAPNLVANSTVSDLFQGLSQKDFISMGTINIGRVKESDSTVDGGVDEVDHVRFRLGWTVEG